MGDHVGSQVVVVVTIVGLLASSVGLPAVASVGSPQSQGVPGAVSSTSATAPAPVPLRPAVPPQNNSTQHVDPDDISARGDLAAVQAWLADRLADRLGNSTFQLSQGEYQLARTLIGDNYSERLEQFVDVAGDTGSTADDNATDTLRETRTVQREFVDAVQTYRTTYDEYRAAREAGDTARARELARDLERQAERVNRTGGRLLQLYGSLGTLIDADLTETRTRVRTLRTNVVQQQAEVRESVFVATRLTATADRRAVSVVDPLAVTGRLTTANGTALANRSIRVQIAGRTVRTTTDADGRFDLQYRPSPDLPVTTSAFTVAYLPASDAAYLPANATVPIEVRQVTPAIDLQRSPASVGYADRLRVSGSVAAEGRGLSAVPVVVTVGGEVVGRTTATNGSYEVATRLPASVPAGEQTVRVRIPFSDRAVAGTETTVPVTVTETATTLSVTGEAGDGAVTVSGRLTTPAGTPVAGQVLAITLEGTRIATVRTDADGRYERRVSLPADLRPRNGSRSGRLSVTFDGAANLQATSAATTVTLSPVAGADPDPGPDPQDAEEIDAIVERLVTNPVTTVRRRGPLGLFPLWAWGLGGLVTAAGLGLGGYRVLAPRVAALGIADRVRGGSESAATTGVDEGGGESESLDFDTWVPIDEVDDADDDVDRSPMSLAADRLAAGATDEAVEIAYDTARATVAADLGLDGSGTHREFIGATRGDLDTDRQEDLRVLTEIYERAAFAPTAVDEDQAREALELARSLGAS